MTKLINKNKLNTFTNKLWDKITASFVSKTLPNTVTGETMITNGYVGGESTVTKRHNETGINMVGLGVETGYFGIPSLSIPARTHIDKIVCIMHNDAGAIGDTVLGVNVGVVSKSTGRLLEYLKRGETTEIIENPISSGTNALTGDKAISISINRTWEEEVYFIVGAKGLLVGYINSFTISIGGDALKDVGYEFGNGTTQNYVGRIAIYTSKYSLNEVATKAFTSETDINTLKNDYVSKTKENLVTAKTTLTNGWLVDNALSVINNTNAIHTISDNTSWCGTPNLNVAANTYVSYICIAVNDSFDIGREINNIKIGVVKNNGNRVHEIITREGKATVVKNTMGNIDSSKIIMYPIRKSFSEQVYFIAGFNGMKWGNRSGNWQTVRPNIPFPDVDRVLEVNTGNYVPQYFLLSDGIPLNNIIPLINTKANLLNDNTFSGANRFDGSVRLNENVDIRYVTKYEQLLLDGDNKHGSNWAVYFDRNIYIPAGSYVTYLDIRVTDDVNAGTELSRMYIYEVQRGNSISDDRIVRVPFSNSRFGVSNVDGYGKCIRVQFNRTFDRDTYCIIGQQEENGKILVANDTKGDIRQAILDRPFVLNSSHNISSMASATNSKVIYRYNIERVGILQDDIKNINSVLATTIKNTDIGNEANKIPRVGDNGKLDPSILPAEQNGGVRTVNGQSPGANGNATVYSDNINVDSRTSKTIKQALDEKVNGSDAVTSSQAGKIVKLDGNGKINENMLPSSIIKTNLDNTFTRHNRFNDYSPTVHRVFTRAFIKKDINNGNIVGYDVNRYCAYLNEKYNDNNKQVSHVLLPIKNAQVGQNVTLDIFAFNRNNRVISTLSAGTYPIIDEEIAGCKCAKIPVNINTGSEGIGFGFMLSSNSNNHGIACVRNTTGNNNAWSATARPNVNTTINANARIEIPYKICYETDSEVVTRFELENVTQMYPRNLIGEMKQLSYDAGNSLEDGTNTWLRANGQAINSNDYPSLYEKLHTSRVDADIEVTIPMINSQVGYYYICAK